MDEQCYNNMEKTRNLVMKNLTKFKCQYCGKIQPSNWALKIHERTHTGERPFVCPVCNKGFGHKSNMTKHMWVIHKDVMKANT